MTLLEILINSSQPIDTNPKMEIISMDFSSFLTRYYVMDWKSEPIRNTHCWLCE